jgi:hypothetical protein
MSTQRPYYGIVLEEAMGYFVANSLKMKKTYYKNYINASEYQASEASGNILRI